MPLAPKPGSRKLPGVNLPQMVSEVSCFTCGGSLPGPYVAAHGQNYHTDHFRCTVCDTALDPHETNYWCDKLVYCRFHYSTRFAPKCTGCTTAVLAHFVTQGEGECWHPECYAINKFWSIKLAPPNREALKFDTTRRQYEIEEQSYDSKAHISEQIQIQDRVHRIWDHLSTYEISLAICLKSCVSSILGLSADRGIQSDSEAWWTKLKLHCEALLHTIHAFTPPPPAFADLQALGQRLRDQIRYLYAFCTPSSTFKVDKLVENYMIHLIHDILCRILSSTLHLTRQQRDSRLTTVFELLLQLRQATTEQPSSLPLVNPDDFKAVYETPPFDTLGWNQIIESRSTHVPELAGPPMPQPVIPVHLGMGTVGPVRGTVAPPRQSTVVHRASIRRPLSHAAPGAIVSTGEDPPSAPLVKKDPPSASPVKKDPTKPPSKSPRRKTRRKSTPPAPVGEQRAMTPPPAVVKAPQPKSPQIVIQRSSSRSSSRPRQLSNASVTSASGARSKAQAPARNSRSRSLPRKSGKPPRPGTPPHVERNLRNPATLPVPKSLQPPTVMPGRPSPRAVHMETAGPVVKLRSRPTTPASRSTSPVLGSPFSSNLLSDNLPSSKNLFKSAPLSAGVLTMSICQLCEYLSSTPSGQILSLVRHKEIHGVKHEFLVMRVRGPSGLDHWLRVERAAKRAQSWIRSLFSTFPAKDTARICGSEKEILHEEEPSTVEAEVRFDSPPTLLDLEKLLTIVAEESVDYKLWPENCFFFAAAVQENLLARHGGYLFSGKQELKNLAQDVRARIRARFEES